MPDRGGEPVRDATRRAADHAGIDRLARELLPTLIDRLATTRLGELEVREGAWRVRLRRPAGGPGTNYGRRSTDRVARPAGHGLPERLAATPGAAHPAAPAAVDARKGRADPVAATGGNGTSLLAAVGPGAGLDGATRRLDDRQVATSPAVGVFQPGAAARPGAAVRAGDRIGIVDVLGIPQEVLAPADGEIDEILVDAGTAVEYGQDLVTIASGARAEA